MMPTVAIALAVAIAYAVNTLKIRLATRGISVAAATMEATQGFLYIYVLMEILGSTDSGLGTAAYVVGAFAGTLGAMLFSNRNHRAAENRCPSRLVPDSPLGHIGNLGSPRSMRMASK